MSLMPNPQTKILIVEDEAPLLAVLTKRLVKSGYQVQGAANGEEGLKLALSWRPDLILLDIIMPRMNGLTLFRRLRQDPWGRGVKVIMLTNLTDPEHIAANPEKSGTPVEPHSEVAEEQIRTFFQSHLGSDTFDYIIKSNWKLEDVLEKVRQKLLA